MWRYRHMLRISYIHYVTTYEKKDLEIINYVKCKACEILSEIPTNLAEEYQIDDRNDDSIFI